MTEKKVTLCIGDRVERTLKASPAVKKQLMRDGFWRGVIVDVHMAKDNKGRPSAAARVKFDGDGPTDRPLPWLFGELRKAGR